MPREMLCPISKTFCKYTGGDSCGYEALNPPRHLANGLDFLFNRSQVKGAAVEKLCERQLHGGQIIVTVIGPVNSTRVDNLRAFEIGRAVAREGWLLLTGGGEIGVMGAANQGAKLEGGTTIGIMPYATNFGRESGLVDIKIQTDMGQARNVINVLSGDVVVACGIAAGTSSEISLAIKVGKKIVLMSDDEEANRLFQRLGNGQVVLESDPDKAMITVKTAIKDQIRISNRKKSLD